MDCKEKFIEYKCENPDIFNKIESDRNWFYDFVCFQYQCISFNERPIKPLISKYNVMEAHALYLKDIYRLENMENGGNPAEETKRAAFLAYWLRRLSPIHGILSRPNVSLAEDDIFLRLYANEFCALDLAFRLIRYFEVQKIARLIENSPKANLILDEGYQVKLEKLCDIRSYALPKDYIKDFCHLLKEKNLSPHALYVIMKSLFVYPFIPELYDMVIGIKLPHNF